MPSDLEKLQPEKIIIRMPNWIGDLIMATPLLKALRRHYQNAEITAMCQSNVSDILKFDPHIDEILSFKKISGWIYGASYDIIMPLRFGSFNLGILTTNSFSSAWLFYRGDVDNRIGFKGRFRSWLLNAALDYPKDIENRHQIQIYKELLAPLGIKASNDKPKLYLNGNEIKNANEFLSKLGLDAKKDILIGINPGAAYGMAKCWLPERFQETVRKLLANPDYKIIFFGDAASSSLVRKICGSLDEKRVFNLAGKTNLRELMALISMMRVFLSNDSGPMHIASALNIPTVALFGSTNPIKTGPYGNFKVLQAKVDCSPCYKRVCPIDFRCMKNITADQACNAIEAMIYPLKVLPEEHLSL